MKFSVQTLVIVLTLMVTVVSGCGISDNGKTENYPWIVRILIRPFCLTWNSQIGDPYGLNLYEFGKPNESSVSEADGGTPQRLKLEQLTGWKTVQLRPAHKNMIKTVNADYVAHNLAQIRIEYNKPSRLNAERMGNELKKCFHLSPGSYEELNGEQSYSLEFVGHPKPESWGRLEWKEGIQDEPEMTFCWRGLLSAVPYSLQESILEKLLPYLENEKGLNLEYPEFVSSEFSFNGYRRADPAIIDLIAKIKSRGEDGFPMTTRWGFRMKYDNDAGEFILSEDNPIKLLDSENSYERAALRVSGTENSWSSVKLSFCEPNSTLVQTEATAAEPQNEQTESLPKGKQSSTDSVPAENPIETVTPPAKDVQTASSAFPGESQNKEYTAEDKRQAASAILHFAQVHQYEFKDATLSSEDIAEFKTDILAPAKSGPLSNNDYPKTLELAEMFDSYDFVGRKVVEMGKKTDMEFDSMGLSPNPHPYIIEFEEKLKAAESEVRSSL